MLAMDVVAGQRQTHPISLAGKQPLGHEQDLLVRIVLGHALGKVGGVGVDLLDSQPRIKLARAQMLTMVAGGRQARVDNVQQ